MPLVLALRLCRACRRLVVEQGGTAGAEVAWLRLVHGVRQCEAPSPAEPSPAQPRGLFGRSGARVRHAHAASREAGSVEAATNESPGRRDVGTSHGR